MVSTHDALERAWSLRMSDPASARELAEAALPAPESRVVLAYGAWRGGFSDDALDQIALAAAQWRGQAVNVWQTRAKGMQGVALLSLGQVQQGLRCLQQQLQWGEDLGDIEMQGLAHNDIGVVLQFWNDPGGGRQRCQTAYEIFQAGGPAHAAGLGLAAINLSHAYRGLDDMARSGALLAQALEVLPATRAWPYWVLALNEQALRLAAAGQLEEARQLSLNAEQAHPDLPLDSLNNLRFIRARIEAQFGDAQMALTLLDALEDWADIRQGMIDYLDVRAGALERCNQPQEAYQTMRLMVTAMRRHHEQEQAIELKTQETLRLIEEAQQTADTLRERTAVLETLHREASELSLTDDLTQLGNRRALAQWSEDCQNRDAPVVMALIDVDYFKDINDRCGHAAGDEVLRALARLLQTGARPEDMVVRLGGDEFVVAREDRGTQTHELSEDMERLRRDCTEHLQHPCVAGQAVTLSIGVGGISGTLDDSIRRADEGMYLAKREGRNRVRMIE